MKKNVIIVILVFISISTSIYGFYQHTEAKRQEALAVANAEIAQAATHEAEKQRDAAEGARAMAEQQRTLAELNAKEAARQHALAIAKCK